MSAGKQRIPRNMARIEFLACRELIESLLAQGFDKKKIHARLAKDGQVTMSYDAFCKVLLKASRNELHIQSLTPPPTPTPVTRKPTTPVASPRFQNHQTKLGYASRSENRWPGKVIGVSDGDTITVLRDERHSVKIRLHGIDCPEKKQAWGNRATQATNSLCHGKIVDV